MLNHRTLVTLVFASALTGSVMAARPTNITDHVPQIDGPMNTMTGPNGLSVAAWAYRASGEFDIAISTRDSATSIWSAPVFFGRRNRADEADPAITFDADGSVYVAFSTANPSRVALAVLPANSNTWMEPVIVSGVNIASSPSLLIVGDRLVVAYQTARGVGMVELPLVGSGNQVNGVADGPDTTGQTVKGRNGSTYSDVTPVFPPPDPNP